MSIPFLSIFRKQKGEADDSGNEDTDDGYACASGSTKQTKKTLTTANNSDSATQSNPNSVLSSSSNNRRNDLLNELLLELTGPSVIWNDQTSYLSQLPPEVMLTIMKCMDDLSIYALAKASYRWRQLIDSTVDWKQFIRRRWPLFPVSEDDDSSYLSRIYDQLYVNENTRKQENLGVIVVYLEFEVPVVLSV